MTDYKMTNVKSKCISKYLLLLQEQTGLFVHVNPQLGTPWTTNGEVGTPDGRHGCQYTSLLLWHRTLKYPLFSLLIL